jgi:hypothetical protein
LTGRGAAKRDDSVGGFTRRARVPAVIFFLAFALSKQGIVGAPWCYPAAIAQRR